MMVSSFRELRDPAPSADPLPIYDDTSLRVRVRGVADPHPAPGVRARAGCAHGEARSPWGSPAVRRSLCSATTDRRTSGPVWP